MYDPSDERVNQIFDLLVRLLRSVPDNLAKQSLARLFEEQAVLEVLVEEHARTMLTPGRVEDAMAEHWDRVEEVRNRRAEAFLHAMQREEF